MREIKFRCWDKRNNKMTGSVTLEYILKDEPFEDLEGCIFMQYTGLKDKNGKEIYEGDILRECCEGYDSEKDFYRYWQVKFGETDEKRYGYFLENTDEELVFVDTFSELEIAGNIYENPKLSKRL